MSRKVLPSLLVGALVVILSWGGYGYLLKQLIVPYQVSLAQTRDKIEQRNNMRRQIGFSVMPDERERILTEQFGLLPTESEINLQLRVVTGWRRFCMIVYGFLAVGTLLHYALIKPTYGHLALHAAALPAFAFALPMLFFPLPTLRLIKPASALFSLLFFAILAYTLLRARNRSQNQTP